MKQSVNLYTEAFRPSREWLTLGGAAVALVLVLALIAGAGALVQYRLAASEEKLAEVARRSEHRQQTVETLQSRVDSRTKDPALEEQVARLEQRLRDRRRLVARADSVARASSEGFSPYLEGLARQSLEGLWLKRIRVDLMRDRLGLSGRAVNGQKVPDYLQRLRQEPVFEGRRFARFSIERVDNSTRLRFQVASTRGAAEEEQ